MLSPACSIMQYNMAMQTKQKAYLDIIIIKGGVKVILKRVRFIKNDVINIIRRSIKIINIGKMIIKFLVIFAMVSAYFFAVKQCL